MIYIYTVEQLNFFLTGKYSIIENEISIEKKEQPMAALKNFNDICPIIPVGVGCLIRQP